MTQAPTPGPLTSDASHIYRETSDASGRLAPTAPVEASGSEREVNRTFAGEAIRDLAKQVELSGPHAGVIAIPLWAARDILAVLRPQPSGETRALIGRLSKSLADATRLPGINFTPDVSVDDLRAILALLFARPLALGGQHSGGEWRCEDCGAQADEWFDCCKNPARAEAQDEGAAGWDRIEREKWIADAWDFVERSGSDPEACKIIDCLLSIVDAHPSPTPAADADRVRIAVEALEKADAAARSGAAMSAADYSISAERLGEEIYKITTPALDALKSTAAKEGGAA